MYYYKDKQGTIFVFKEPRLEGWLIPITKEEVMSKSNPIVLTQEQIDKIKEMSMIRQEINDLEKWFNEYDIQVNQYQRALRNGVKYDKNIIELDTLAFVKAERLKELRTKVGE